MINTRRNGWTVIAIAQLLAIVLNREANASIEIPPLLPASLRCEYLIDPIGIDVLRPRLSWTLSSNHRGAMQTAYEIAVASSRDILRSNRPDGKVVGRPIAARCLVFVRKKLACFRLHRVEMDGMIEPLGVKLRRQRRKLGLTQDELAGRAGISKPYLSLIETGRVTNPPSDEKLRRLEQTLGFGPGELLSQAQLHRTPREVRAMLQRLMEATAKATVELSVASSREGAGEASGEAVADSAGKTAAKSTSPIDLDQAFASGVLQELVDQITPNVETIDTKTVPVINRVSAGYPSDFTDLSYPPRVADEYVGCPELNDPEAFAARVHGDSMVPKYRPGDIVIFSPAAGVRDGDDCFVRFADGQTTFKRVFFENSESDESLLRLQPRNERYRPQSIPAERVSGLYRAMFKYQRVDEE